jgi:hypothetical protein
MKIELNKEQYRSLIELIFLGNWLANGTRTGAEGDEWIEKYEEIEKYILSYSVDYDMKELVTEENGDFFTSKMFEEKLFPLIDEYDDYTFWELLAERLAKRDLIKEIGPVRKITDSHRKRQYELESTYEDEFEKNGIKDLIIQRK